MTRLRGWTVAIFLSLASGIARAEDAAPPKEPEVEQSQEEDLEVARELELLENVDLLKDLDLLEVLREDAG